MAFVTKVWRNRLVEFAGRRKLKNVATGEESIFDVSRSEGVVSQTGDAFSDANMNDLEQRIKNQFDTVDSNLAAANVTKSLYTTLPGATKTTGLKATINFSGYNYVNVNFAEANSAYNFGKVSIDTIKRSASNLYQINSGAGSGPGTTDGRGNILKIFIDGNTVSLTLGQLDSYSTTYGVFIDAWLSVF